MFEHGFPEHWSTLKKLIWLKGAGIIGGASGIWKTVTGTLIHITDALASPMQKCEVTLEPIQDLHGQDAPYPAGGGKNKFDGVFQQGTFTNEGEESATNTRIRSNFIPVSEGPVAISTPTANALIHEAYAYDSSKNFVRKIGFSPASESQVATIQSGESFMRFSVRYPDNSIITPNDNVKAQVEANSTATPWSPYENICPITGWTGCEVNRTGVNVWDEEWEVGALIQNGTVDSSLSSRRTTSFIPVVPSTTYSVVNGFVIGGRCAFYDKSKNIIAYSGDGISSFTFTTPANAYYLRITIQAAYGTTYNHDISINYPSTDTGYHAYSGTTLSVTFPDSAGTVYGGTVDLVSGVLTVDRAKIVLNGTQEIFVSNWRATSTSVGWIYRYGITNNKIYSRDQDVPNILCSTLETASYGNAYYGTVDNAVTTQAGVTPTGGICIRVSDLSLTNTTAINNYLSANPIEVVYELAEPTEIQLTPQEISTLEGENNVWSNSNGETTLIYKAQAE